MGRLVRSIGLVALCAGVMAFGSGCDSGGDDGGGSSKGGSVVGTWAMNEGSADTGGDVSWYVFSADGTFSMFNDAALTSRHLGGTFTQNGNKVTGPFTNPGVGDGEIDCTLADDGKTMQMDFIEHWHSPSKHVPFFGTKL